MIPGVIIRPVQEDGQFLAEFIRPGKKVPVAYTEWHATAAKRADTLKGMALALVRQFRDDHEFLTEIQTVLLEGVAQTEPKHVNRVAAVMSKPARMAPSFCREDDMKTTPVEADSDDIAEESPS